ncbi:23S rRNA (guanosine(2251)-2'-O)-methyltransferase RlmB [Hyphococcus luteus]|uniref:23S rRNA (Guanosine(2251)-2'-O)-methyltransferase RlmB n=1 Tax=Hyphococcus luteus TaxID=2058213 RepID=A0A2S7K0Z1_9PROT|nr:23S rRNA (guanosine(2251)-2'-O)-methyltransferase RlmB [Marinicaulis flavus]PQA86088.1 23S rRNA (guanosine(2251)-2'-O)-methyltransferase RlmB [Marinicaulis flavus]
MKEKAGSKSKKPRPAKGRARGGRSASGKSRPPADGLWLYGRHAVAAALANPERKVKRVVATKNAAGWLADHGASETVLARLEDLKPDAIDKLLHEGAVHQGLAALVEELPRARLKDVCAPADITAPVLILDQITDPQNIGALFRAAAAFGARAVIVQERRTPPLSGALAKAAAGAVETMPCVQAVNIARALEALQNLGYHCAGLAGEAEAEITEFSDAPLALVMGAEGAGLRQLVAATCNKLYRIPISSGVESLNVSNAAAVSLYEVMRRKKP